MDGLYWLLKRRLCFVLSPLFNTCLFSFFFCFQFSVDTLTSAKEGGRGGIIEMGCYYTGSGIDIDGV